MKQSLFLNHGVLLLVLLVLLSSYTTSAGRFLLPVQDQEEVSVSVVQQKSTTLLEGIDQDDSMDLIGEDDHCENGDEQCFDRRMMAEAHLDYIYTQRHNKP